MGKIMINTCHKYNNNVYNCCTSAIKNKNILIYNENNCIMKVEIFSDSLVMTRKCKDYTLKFNLKESLGSNIICDYGNYSINVPCHVEYLIMTDKKIETKYFIDNEVHEYMLEY